MSWFWSPEKRLKRILYLQYSNPAAYPPLQHSSRILADSGWCVLFVGISPPETSRLGLPADANIRVKAMRQAPRGALQKLQYAVFLCWVVATGVFWRAQWVYVSDVLAALPGLILQRVGCKVIYHEHDIPAQLHEHALRTSAFMRCMLAARRHLTRSADFIVVPNADRARIIVGQTRTETRLNVVMNCPSLSDAVAVVHAPNDAGFVLYYHGGLGHELLPLTLIEAMAATPGIQLLAVGYSSLDAEGYLPTFLAAAEKAGLGDRVQILPAANRRELLRQARSADAGWAGMPVDSANLNFQSMAGASNKVFDYLACALPVIVPDRQDWKEMFVSEGYGVACDPADSASIAVSLQWLATNRDKARQMGERGRKRILADWNYEAQFAPVLRNIVLET